MLTVKSLPIGSPIMVYRESGGWSGPHSISGIDEKCVEFASQTRYTRLPLYNARPYVPVTLYTRVELQFVQSRKEEVARLENIGSWKVVPRAIAQGQRIFRGTFVDVIKPSGIAKSRLVICGTNDQVKTLTAAPTVQRYSIRATFCVAACRRDFWVKVRDITMAFVHSETELTRTVYLEPPPELGMLKDQVLLIRRPLYGLVESPLHWYGTFSRCHTSGDGLDMEVSAQDPCLFSCHDKSAEGHCIGVANIQVDDATIAGNDKFHEHEESHYGVIFSYFMKIYDNLP
jgi:hypothetical protein